MVNKEKKEFVEQIIREIENLYPEEFEEVIFKRTTGYGGELFYNKLIITWSVDDVKEMKPGLTEEQCRDVLSYIGRHHNANEGINWEVIRTTIRMMDFDKEEEDG